MNKKIPRKDKHSDEGLIRAIPSTRLLSKALKSSKLSTRA